MTTASPHICIRIESKFTIFQFVYFQKELLQSDFKRLLPSPTKKFKYQKKKKNNNKQAYIQ